VIHYYHCAGFDDALHLNGVGHRRCDQDAGDTRVRHQLRLRYGGGTHARGTQCDLPPGDLRAFVSLGMRTERFTALFDVRGHASEVRLKLFNVKQQCGRGDLILGEQGTIMATARATAGAGW